jgi:hypothetical protein
VILELLKGEKHATSTHVRREWIRLIEGTTADVLNAMDDGQEELGAIFAKLSQGWGREAGQRLRVLAMLAGRNRQVSAVELRLRARQVLRSSSKQMFEHYLDEVRDGSECGLARNEVETVRGGRLVLVDKCKRTDVICRQDNFISENLGDWSSASQGLAKHSRRTSDQKMGKLGLEIAGDPPKGKGKNCYGRTGDISISTECAKDETLLTTDQSFEAIAKERGLLVTRVQGTSPP